MHLERSPLVDLISTCGTGSPREFRCTQRRHSHRHELSWDTCTLPCNTSSRCLRRLGKYLSSLSPGMNE